MKLISAIQIDSASEIVILKRYIQEAVRDNATHFLLKENQIHFLEDESEFSLNSFPEAKQIILRVSPYAFNNAPSIDSYLKTGYRIVNSSTVIDGGKTTEIIYILEK